MSDDFLERLLSVLIRGLRLQGRGDGPDVWQAVKDKFGTFGTVVDFVLPRRSYDNNWAYITMDTK